MSVPERMRTYSSALAAVRVKRGSTTIILRAGFLGVQHVQHRHRVRLGGVRADVQRALACSACRCTNWSSRRSPRCSRRRRPWSSGRCAPGGRSCCVPKNDTNLRSRYDCSLLCLDEPTQNTASGPLSLRIASSLSPISLIAWSQLMRWYLPLTSFIGVLAGGASLAMPCSRIDAPLAQCAPRLIGESNTGSWRIQTPFSTTASIAQPTEQCVQTVRLTSIFFACAFGGRLGACRSC